MKKFIVFILAMNISVSFGQHFDTFESESLFLRRLNEERLHDFSELQLSLMSKRFSNKSDLLYLLYGEFYALQGQYDRAKISLSKISQSSSQYPHGILKLIDITRNTEGKKDGYVKYFHAMKDKPVPIDLNDAHRNAILLYSKLLSDEGNINKALETLKYFDQLPHDESLDDRKFKLIQCQFFLNSVSNLADKGGLIHPYKNQIETTVNDLETLVWKLDNTAAKAYAELAHAYNLLGKPENAVEILKTGGDFLFKLEQAITKKNGDAARSPLKLANFYIAEAFFKLAEKSFSDSKSETAEDYYSKSITKYNDVANNYYDSTITSKAFLKVTEVKVILEDKFGKKVQFSSNQEQVIKFKAGKSKLQAKEYQTASTLLLESAATDLSWVFVPESLFYASISCYKIGRLIEAMAICQFLQDNFPKNDFTHKSMYNLAAHLWKQSGNLSKDKLLVIDPKSDAIELFSQFIRIAPQHANAPKSAMIIAEAQYELGRKQYLRLMESDSDNPSNEKVSREKMHYDFDVAARLYDFILQKYSDNAEGVKALSRLGWINMMLRKHEVSANYFLKHHNKLSTMSLEKIASKYLAAVESGKIKKFNRANDHLGELLHVFDNNAPLLKFESYQNYHKRTLDLLASNNEILAELSHEVNDKTKFFDVSINCYKIFAGRYPGDRKQTPNIMLKTAKLYLKMGDHDNGIRWFAKLGQNFPDTSEGKHSGFLLGKTYCELELWDKASFSFSKLSSNFPSMPLENLRFIAGKLFGDIDGKNLTGIDPKIVMAANEEILSRGKSKKTTKSFVKEQAVYRIGQCEMVMQNYKNAITRFNELTISNPPKNKKTLSYYYFDALLYKAACLKKTKQYQDALTTLIQLTSQLNKNTYPEKYYNGLLAAGETLLEMGDLESVKKSMPRFLNIMTFADIQNSHQRDIIEQAYFQGAVACIKIGDNIQFERIRKNYLTAFPEGKFNQEINSLTSGNIQ